MLQRPPSIGPTGQLLGGSLLVLAWLPPQHGQPWPAFLHELLAVLGVLALAAAMGASGAIRVGIPGPARWVLLLAAVPIGQWLAGQVRFFGDALLASTYLAGFAAAITVGSHWRRSDPQALTNFTATWTSASALATVALATVQWLGLDALGVMLADLPPGARPTGNIGQANHFATLSAWGLVGAWLLYERRWLPPVVAGAVAMVLLFGLAMSQSRTGWVHVGLLAMAATLAHRRRLTRLGPVTAWALAASFAALVWQWSAINAALQLQAPLSLAQLTQGGSRLAIWRQAADTIAASPWVGYGWTQAGLAAQVLGEARGAQVPFSHAHNLILDLALWVGVPLALAIAVVAGRWLWRRVRQIHSADLMLLALVPLTLLVHSMFEFPHSYAYFLLPAGLVLGALDAGEPSHAARRIEVGRRAWNAGWIGLAAILAVMTWEYLSVEEAFTRQRFGAARIATRSVDDAQPRDPVVLTQLDALLWLGRTEPLAGLDERTLAQLRRAVERFPGPASQIRLAVALARNSHQREAEGVLRTLCAIHRQQVCENALHAWTELATQDPLLAGVEPPRSPGRRDGSPITPPSLNSQ